MATDLSKRLLMAALASGGSPPPPSFTNPLVALVGNSIFDFGSVGPTMGSNHIISRDTSGLVTVMLTNHGIVGSPRIYPHNFSSADQADYEVIGRATTSLSWDGTTYANTPNWFQYQTTKTGDPRGFGGTALTISNPGDGYTAGTATNVALTGGTGTGALATVIAFTAGTKTRIAIVYLTTQGSGYTVGDVLTVPSGTLGSPTVAATVTITALGADTPTTTSQGRVSDMERHTSRGIWPWLNGAFKGSLQWGYNWGQQSDRSTDMTSALAKALAQPGLSMVLLEPGTNDVYAYGNTAASTNAGIAALIQQCVTAGVFVVVMSIMPQTTASVTYSSAKAAVAASVNATTQALVASLGPSKALYVDATTAFLNGAGPDGNPALFSATDGVHPNSVGNKLLASLFATALSSIITPTQVLSTSSSDTGAIPGYSLRVPLGPFTGDTMSGTYVNAGSGPLPTNWQAGRSSGSATATFTNSAIGDGTTLVTASMTGGASNDTYDEWFKGSNGISIGALNALGFAIGDEIAIGLEATWSNANAANIRQLSLYLRTNSSGGFGRASTLEYTESLAAAFPDSASNVTLITGRMKLTPGTTAVVFALEQNYIGASGSALSLSVDKVTLLKAA